MFGNQQLSRMVSVFSIKEAVRSSAGYGREGLGLSVSVGKV